MSLAIKNAIKRDNWVGARRLIRKSLRKESDSHWLFSRLALTYYEEGNYQRALTLGQKALELSPNCPLALWDQAGSLDMLGRLDEAITIYRDLARRGVKSLAYGDCGEGLSWARGLVADCWYRLARCSLKLGRQKGALQNYEKHLEMRGPGCRSIYPIKQVRKELGEIITNMQRKELDRRLEDYHRHPQSGSSWKTVKNSILRRK